MKANRYNRLSPTALLLIFLFAHGARAQVSDANPPETFAKLFVDAINSKRSERCWAILHPKSKARINAKTQPHYD